MGIISVDRPTVATGNLCLYLYNSGRNRIRAVHIYIRILLGSRERRVQKQTIWHKWHVVEWPDPRHQIWVGAAMAEQPARCSVAQIPTYTTSWTVLPAQIWELCLSYIHVHYLHYLHVRYYTFTLYKSLIIFYRVMLPYLYTFNTWYHIVFKTALWLIVSHTCDGNNRIVF